jgi:hypothetical protein
MVEMTLNKVEKEMMLRWMRKKKMMLVEMVEQGKLLGWMLR